MANNNLNETTFKSLQASDSGAFLAVADATSELQQQYADIGLHDAAGIQRIVRVVTLKRGFRLFKLTHYNTLRPVLSSWWSSKEAFQENHMSIQQVFETALLNGVSLREFIRFISAVPLDWNLLDYYIELRLNTDVQAYWGQFTAQQGIHNKNISEVELSQQKSPGTDNTMLHYDSDPNAASEVYLPEMLGGFGAWQLYIPDFQKSSVDAAGMVSIAATDNAALGRHFEVTPEREQKLLQQRQDWQERVTK